MNNENIRKEFEDYLNISHNKFWLILLGTNKNVRFLKEAEKNGQLDAYLQDFASAVAFRKIFMKLGQNYVYCTSFVPIPYHQIAKVYVEKLKNRGVIIAWSLILKDRQGKQLMRVPMLEEAESNGELATVINVLKTKNPAIYLGYV